MDRNQWIERHFVVHPTCRMCVEDSDKPGFCVCKRPAAEHPQSSTEKWSVSKNCSREPTTRYGTIVFSDPSQEQDASDADGSEYNAPFVCLSSKSKPLEVVQLLTEHWGLDAPRMLLSVTGGARSFDLPPLLQNMISDGLERAAACGSVWIVTGGMNSGVMRRVAEWARANNGDASCPIIAISPWAALSDHNKAQMHVRGDRAYLGDPNHVHGKPDPENPVVSSRLDRNHTHFVLVDNGCATGFGGEIETRGLIEGELLRWTSTGEFGTSSSIAGLTIAIQGGPGTLETCINGMQSGMPLLVVQGSGLAADLIAYVSNLYRHKPGYTERGLEQLVVDLFGNAHGTAPYRRVLDLAHQCGQLTDLIYIYSVDYLGSNPMPFDRAILDALLDYDMQRSLARQAWATAPLRPADRAAAADLERVRKLEFALLWRRIDIARKVMAQCRLLTPKEIHQRPAPPDVVAKVAMLKYALVNDLRDFVELFLGVMDEAVLRGVLTLLPDKLSGLIDDSMMMGCTLSVTRACSPAGSPASSRPSSQRNSPLTVPDSFTTMLPGALMAESVFPALPSEPAGHLRAKSPPVPSALPPLVLDFTPPGGLAATTHAPRATSPQELSPLAVPRPGHRILPSLPPAAALGLRRHASSPEPYSPGHASSANPNIAAKATAASVVAGGTDSTDVPRGSSTTLKSGTLLSSTAFGVSGAGASTGHHLSSHTSAAIVTASTLGAAAALASATNHAHYLSPMFTQPGQVMEAFARRTSLPSYLPSSTAPLVRVCVPLPIDIDGGYPPRHLEDHWDGLAKEFHAVVGSMSIEEDADDVSGQHYKAVRYLVGLLASHGYVVSHYRASRPLHQLPDSIPDLPKLSRLAAINHFHDTQHARLRAGLSAMPWTSLDEHAQEHRVRQMLQFFHRILRRDYRIWQPALLEELYVQVATTEARATHVLALFKGGMMRRQQINTVVKALVCKDYRLGLHAEGPASRASPSPYFELLLWAVLSNRKELVEYFWLKDTQNAIVNAIVVAKISRSIVDLRSHFIKPEVISELNETAIEFSGKALALLLKCEDLDSEGTSELMRQRTLNSGALPFWRLCYRCGEAAMLASAPAQRVVREQWSGKLKSTSVIKILAAIVMPLFLVVYAPRSLKEKSGSNFVMTYLRRLGWIMPLHLQAEEYVPESTTVVAKVLHAPTLLVQEQSTRRGFRQTIFNRFQQFYSSPTVYYWTEVLSWLTFVVLFSFVAVAPIQDAQNYAANFGTTVANVRTIVYVWLCVLIMDEGMQLYQQGRTFYFSNMWNTWDMLIVVLTVAAISLLHSDNSSDVESGRTIWALCAMSHWLRIGRLYASSPVLGPKIVMIRQMFADIMVFIALLVIVLVGYGVALYSFIFPYRSLDQDTLSNIVYWPYFQVFGESRLDEIRELSGCLGDQFTSCSGQGYLSVALLAVYILIANVLLVNLLIAMMSSTFQRVNDSSRETWALQNAELLEEIRARVKLLGPLSILSHVYYIFKWGRKNASVSPDRGPPPEPDEHVGKMVATALSKHVKTTGPDCTQLADMAAKIAEMQSVLDQLRQPR